MKKIKILLFVILGFLILITPITVRANMAAPKPNDVGTTIVFEKNDSINVTKEILDIRVNELTANISAVYYMKNIKNEDVKTESMFISPNIENSKVIVEANNKPLDYNVDPYYIIYDPKIVTEDWKYVVLEKDGDPNYDLGIQTISFSLEFAPLEEVIVRVNYDYRLGGRPERIDDSKYAEIKYYLLPAGMWNGFTDLTINLYLDDSLPLLEESSLNFTHVKDNQYEYKSNQLPKTNLELRLNRNGWQSFWAQFHNPLFIVTFIGITLISLLIIISTIILSVVLVKKHKKLYK